MPYEINISKNGHHYFATAVRSIGYSSKTLKEIYNKLKAAFPEDEGFSFTVTNCEKIGRSIDIEKI